MIKVKNLHSNKSGREVANQFQILIDDGIYFQSYDKIIACMKAGRTYLDKNYWDYSVTTGKYRNQFLGETLKETRQKIKSGEYELEDLNKIDDNKSLGE